MGNNFLAISAIFESQFHLTVNTSLSHPPTDGYGTPPLGGDFEGELCKPNFIRPKIGLKLSDIITC
jgi:hypothetical protein